MGSSAWNYFVPYQQEIEKALNDLREEVFRNGKYYMRPKSEIDPDEFLDAPKEILEILPEWIEREKSFTIPNSIDDLLEWNGEEATHSILDFTKIGLVPDFGTVTLLSDNQLLILFGTDKPTRHIIEQNSHKIWDLQNNWGAIYIIVYKDNMPDEIFFGGHSGD